MGGGEICAVVVNWNRRDDTLRCLASLSAAAGMGCLVVVDNGSTDGSVEAIRQRFPQTIVIQTGGNLGFAAGSNRGADHFLKRTSHRFLFLLNNDAVIAADTVEQLIGVAKASEAIGLAVPKIYYANTPDRLWYAGGYINWKKGTCEHYGFGKQDRRQFDLQRDISFASGAAVLIKRRLIEELGLFDKRYYMLEEDVEFSIRARRAGYTIRYVPEARAWHKVGASTASRGDAFVWYYLIRNRLYTMRTHARTHQWLQFLVYFPLLCLWKSIWYAWRGNPAVASAIARGILDHLRGCVGETFTQESPSTPG
jgi:GT2 family glycosyltransferase